MKIRRGVRVKRDPAQVFALVSDPDRYPEFFTGITRWEPRSRKQKGEGAKFRVLMKVGSIEAGGTVRIAEWKQDERIAWESDAGIEQRGAWEIRPAAGGSELQLEIEFSLAGIFGWAAERLAGRVVERHMTATLLAARRLLEFEDRPKPTTRSPGRKATAGRGKKGSRSKRATTQATGG